MWSRKVRSDRGTSIHANIQCTDVCFAATAPRSECCHPCPVLQGSTARLKAILYASIVRQEDLGVAVAFHQCVMVLVRPVSSAIIIRYVFRLILTFTGFYCPAGSTSKTAQQCKGGRSKFCPAGSSAPWAWLDAPRGAWAACPRCAL